MAEPPRIEAVDRAVRLLVALAEAGPDGAALGDLADTVGVNKSTAYRALTTLRGHAFAMQSESTGRYRLGPSAIALGDVFWGSDNLPVAVHPALVALSREVGELVHLGVMADDQVLYVDKVEPERAIRVWSSVGQRAPAATTSMGRALLAAGNVPDDHLGIYLRAVPADRAVTWEHLQDVVHEARSRGYATEIEENEPGVACIGMAILRGNRTVGALSITSLADRMTPGRQRELAAVIRGVVGPLLPEGLVLAGPAGAFDGDAGDAGRIDGHPLDAAVSR
ncbi:IclR family transcriptional regulator [Geodermatophilus sp. YIM 151500]|uniref:IclR family transcriptional regulator n=1 Tax=Geodermatophilus sp. YIM 151500 TaxID=2984531 RepID=UPI0021E42813|nr:IclR family transcriptional regulator [Geodermatophilus sp. YIM 151500]MCV2489165.1 IclR family transcriptional regulator [Geodermatophilus sp. YIM 151500]